MLSVLLLYVAVVWAQNDWCDPLKQRAIMIDAGSSGSRLYVYSWPQRVLDETSKSPPLSYPLQEIIPKNIAKKLQVTPGISSFVEDKEGLVESLSSMISHVELFFSSCKERMSSTPIYLKATGGMRLLGLEEQHQILGYIREYFSTLQFDFKASNVGIISGQQEAAFLWISIQYIMKALQLNSKLEESTTFGVLDLGGASTQIAYLPKTPIVDSTYPFQLGFVEMEIFGDSFLGFGTNQIKKRALQKLYNGSNITFPCYFSGYEVQFLDVTVTGSSDYSSCVKLLESLLFLDEPCLFHNCSINGRYLPVIPQDMKFFAVSAYAFSVSNLGLPESVSLNTLKSVTQKTCEKSWTEIQSMSNHAEFAEEFCFGPVYSLLLLQEVYGFRINSTDISFVNKINGTSATWVLGAILHEANMLDFVVRHSTSRNSCSISSAWWVITLVAFSCFFTGILLAAFWIKTKSQSGKNRGKSNATHALLKV